ncbi:hypothetical protein [Profundibacterium mesophilum]|uniref:Uncharacterized protein n=1 Tax=Profundibacterium mesophilum KAUST100406-0324 TaxID=1037889 RepID=A0A921TC22_9RHOB|nr:hypothetical protein [Profundibacterium mesophilum]KAF0676560.1 hypothetical protein PMES_01292 [Profundibacterium mesophilum KAUST100406-0324]
MKAAGALLTLALAIRALPGMAEPVLTYDVTGARSPDTPALLSIEDDGAVTMRGPGGQRQTAHLEPDALEALRDTITDLIAPLAASDQAAPPNQAVGAGFSRIRVKSEDAELAAELRESAFTAMTNPANEPIMAFREAEIILIETIEALRGH